MSSKSRQVTCVAAQRDEIGTAGVKKGKDLGGEGREEEEIGERIGLNKMKRKQ
jgi:hypothetical protein